MGRQSIVPAFLDDRQAMRTAIGVAAHLQAGPACRVPVAVLNVSAHGVMIQIDKTLSPGRPVTLDLPTLGKRPGRIAWARDSHAGVSFEIALSPVELLALI